MSLANRSLSRLSDRLAGNRSLSLLCFILFLVSFWIALWVAFPADVLQRRLVREISQQTGLKMQGSHAALLFPLGLEFDLRVFPDAPGLAPIDLRQLQLTPAWSSLLSGSPQADLQGLLAGGTVEAQAGLSGNLQLRVRQVAIASLQLADQPYLVQGELSGDLTGERLSAAMTGKGEFVLQLSETRVLGLERFGLPDNLSLGLLTLEGRFSQRRLSVEKALLSGGALEMSGGGTLLVGETPLQTRLNLNVRLLPDPSTPAGLRDLLNLSGVKPTADGSYLLRLGGSLARPVVR